MRIIIPMAGMGKRMRPHTLTIPKPLIPVAGKPIVQWLVEDLVEMSHETVEEVAFIVGDFGQEVEEELLKIASDQGAKGSIYYQEEALGTGHAILCAADALKGKVVVAFADTLFQSNFELDESKDGVIWVHKVEDPKAFGVVKLDENNLITDFIEKPQEFVSDLAIIGIYYFKDGEYLKKELQYLIDNDIKDKGEYQITSALDNMRLKGSQFAPGKVTEWMDCGNKDATVLTNQRMLEIKKEKNMVDENVKLNNAIVVEPCYIGPGVTLSHCVVGPHASIGANTVIEDSVIKNCIIQSNSSLKGIHLFNAMIGNFVELDRKAEDLSVGDFAQEKR